MGPGTAFLDHPALLEDLPEAEWYAANIPFVDLPAPPSGTPTTTGGA
ncbi:hypothetical protein [Streptomyces sp. NPDC057616]